MDISYPVAQSMNPIISTSPRAATPDKDGDLPKVLTIQAFTIGDGI